MEVVGKVLQRYYDTHMCEKKGLSKKLYDKEIIVSLTSFPKRFDKLHIVLRSIYNQTMMPNRIVLYLDDGVSIDNVPQTIKQMRNYGLEIEFRPVNMKPHKKYYYAIMENPDSIVITIDDDMIYERELVERLYNAHKMYPDAVMAKRVHLMKTDKNGNILPYSEWEFEYSRDCEPSDALFVTGIGGVLYPPHCLPEEAFEVDKMLKLCANNDDIWLKFMELKKGTRVAYVPGKWIHPCCIMSTQEVALSQDNVGECRNDEYISRLQEYYGIDLAKYCE